jgi:hypothetical protein
LRKYSPQWTTSIDHKNKEDEITRRYRAHEVAQQFKNITFCPALIAGQAEQSARRGIVKRLFNGKLNFTQL